MEAWSYRAEILVGEMSLFGEQISHLVITLRQTHDVCPKSTLRHDSLPFYLLTLALAQSLYNAVNVLQNVVLLLTIHATK